MIPLLPMVDYLCFSCLVNRRSTISSFRAKGGIQIFFCFGGYVLVSYSGDSSIIHDQFYSIVINIKDLLLAMDDLKVQFYIYA